MKKPELTNWLVATLTAIVLTMASVGWSNLEKTSDRLLSLAERVVAVEAQNAEVLRRLERIEAKLDK